MKKTACIEKIAAKVALADSREAIIDDLTYLWEEAVREEGGLMAFADEMAGRVAKDLKGDAGFQKDFLDMKSETYKAAVKLWLMEHFGEWQGQELFAEMDRRIAGGK